jgi:PASTA domain
MRCLYRTAVAVLCGLLFVLFTTPVATATGESYVLQLEPAYGAPGTSYNITATGVSCGSSYRLMFAGITEPQDLEPTGGAGTDEQHWSSTVPNGVEPGSHTVALICEPPVIRFARPNSAVVATGNFEVLRTVDVPKLDGSTKEEAESALKGVGLRLGQVSGGTGRVVGQVPGAGTSLAVGEPVDIVLSVVVVRVLVPNLIRRTVTQARALLKRKGLTLIGATRNGVIATQDPPAGTPVDQGSPVRVTLQAIVRPSTPPPSRPSTSPRTSTSPPASTSPPPSSASTVRPTPSLTSGGPPTVAPGPDGQSGGWILLGASGGAGGLLVLASAVLISRTAIRARERQWIHKHVHAVPRLGDVEPPEVRTDPRFPTSAIRLEPHQDPGTHTVEEEPR